MNRVKDNVGFLLAQICRKHRQSTEDRLAKLGLHIGQEMILLRLAEEEGLTLGQLAEAMSLEPPTITKVVSRMEDAGMLERRPDPQDARVSRVFLTDQSRELIPKINAIWFEMEKQDMAGLTETEQLLLRRLLMQVFDNLNRA